MVRTLWDSITEFIAGGDDRTAALQEGIRENVTPFVPPNLREPLGLLAEANPIQGMYNAGGSMRGGEYADAAFETGLALAPLVAGPAARVGAKQAVDTGADAVEALLDTLLGGSSGRTASAIDTFAERANQPGPVPTMYSNPVGGLLSAEDRIAASTPASWRDPKFEKPQWHPISSTAMRVPATAVEPVVEVANEMVPERAMRIEDLQGRVITPAYGDRTVAGVNILGYNDIPFEQPVRSQGGRDFMREQGTGLWASELSPMSQKSKAIRGLLEQGEDPALVYTAMGAQSGDFSTIMMEAALNQFDPKQIKPAAAKKFDDRMKQLGIKSWPGTKSGKVAEAMRNMPGSTRWAVWQEMDKAGYRDAGFPDIGQTRVSITDPELLNVDPFAAGLTVGRPTGLLTDEEFIRHPSYEWQIGGDYEGSLGNLPGPILWRDFFEARRAVGKSPAGDQRAFMMTSPQMTQRVDQQMVDEINAYLSRQEQAQ